MARADRSMYARVIGNLERLAGVLIIDCGTGLGQPGVQAAILASDQLVPGTADRGRMICSDSTPCSRGATALVGVPADASADLALRGELDISDAPRALRQATVELAAVLALSWSGVGRVGARA